MKKALSVIIILALIGGVFWLNQKNKKAPAENLNTAYRSTRLGIFFTYPKILTASTTSEKVTLHHSVPFTHHDYCDFKGEGTTTIDTLTDFNVDFYTTEKGLVDSMKSESPYIPQENFINGEVVESSGFIDKYTVGKLNGFKIFEGAEGCGRTIYYFPISNKKTLIVTEELVTVFTGAIDTENKEKAEAVEGVINREKETEILEAVLKTIEVR